MAKQSGKKPRKSGKTDSDKSQGSKKKPPVVKQEAKQAMPSSQKKKELLCKLCNKPMKNEKTRKLHERSCKSKVMDKPAKGNDTSSKQNGFESVLLELKDQFNDERDSMFKTFQNKEEHMQRELDEVKTVLRMEMDRHRKELERIGKVEREVAQKQPVHETPPEIQNNNAMPIQEEHIPSAVPRNSQPKAIDLIPMHIPTISKKRFMPLDERETIPDIDEEDLEMPPSCKPSGLDRDAIEALVREIVNEEVPEKPVDGITGKIGQLSGRLDLFDSKIERNLADLRRNMEKIGKDSDMKRVEKELDKISEKVLDIMEDSGYGESLSVSKIPPTILEIVYQAILDDIHIEIMRTKGAQDAEKVARSALEEVRLKTSGSELFKY
ncbi:MAG: hypothetical protein Q7J68_08500, partial [Thermoplasmata archaeon]|nr:hypothetical protein [Thermoplasmata archaeon]